MKELYSALYSELESSVNISELSHFVAMKGKLYNNLSDPNDIRLMIVGRAVNGWTTIDVTSAEAFGEAAQAAFGAEGFTWIDTSQDSLCNFPDEGETKYYLSKSPFWRVCKGIWESLTGRTEKTWINYVAWSNIYKIAPKITGNPTTKVCKAQIVLCRKILQREIEVYRPTHILFVTGFEWWFKDCNNTVGIAELFSNINFLGKNTRCNKQYVEATATYVCSDGKRIPVVVTCRPESRPEGKFIEQTIEYFVR